MCPKITIKLASKKELEEFLKTLLEKFPFSIEIEKEEAKALTEEEAEEIVEETKATETEAEAEEIVEEAAAEKKEE
jgi:hydrogenase maturation factor HypF (carbamoyltransferase family)